jgi:hypothetical protein
MPGVGWRQPLAIARREFSSRTAGVESQLRMNRRAQGIFMSDVSSSQLGSVAMSQSNASLLFAATLGHRYLKG